MHSVLIEHYWILINAPVNRDIFVLAIAGRRTHSIIVCWTRCIVTFSFNNIWSIV
jgi:hypothetical protein